MRNSKFETRVVESSKFETRVVENSKFETRVVENSKFETRNSKQIPMLECSKQLVVCPVSNFGFRISSFRAQRARGFSFAEVMFAVIILGIGFIMVAAIFPVAISQTQASLADSAGATVGRTGSIYMSQLISQGTGTLAAMGDVTSYAQYGGGTLIADGNVHPIDGVGTLTPNRWDRLKGNFIETADARFAWIPIGYKMGDESTGTFGATKSVARYAEFYILAVQSQVKPTFDRLDYDPPPSPGAAPFNVANLRPKMIAGVNIQDNNPTYGVDTATFPAFPDVQHNPLAPGAYILIANDHLDTDANAGEHVDVKMMNGQYYRLGAKLAGDDPAPTVWELQPGGDFTAGPGRDGAMGTADDIIGISGADVLVVGRGFNPSDAPPIQFEGAAMDLFMLPPVIVPLPLSP